MSFCKFLHSALQLTDFAFSGNLGNDLGEGWQIKGKNDAAFSDVLGSQVLGGNGLLKRSRKEHVFLRTRVEQFVLHGGDCPLPELDDPKDPCLNAICDLSWDFDPLDSGKALEDFVDGQDLDLDEDSEEDSEEN